MSLHNWKIYGANGKWKQMIWLAPWSSITSFALTNRLSRRLTRSWLREWCIYLTEKIAHSHRRKTLHRSLSKRLLRKRVSIRQTRPQVTTNKVKSYLKSNGMKLLTCKKRVMAQRVKMKFLSYTKWQNSLSWAGWVSCSESKSRLSNSNKKCNMMSNGTALSG